MLLHCKQHANYNKLFTRNRSLFGFYTSFFGFTTKTLLSVLIILVRDILLAHYLCLFVCLLFILVVVRNLLHVVGFDLLDDNRHFGGGES